MHFYSGPPMQFVSGVDTGGGFRRDRRLGRAFAIAIGQRGWKRQPTAKGLREPLQVSIAVSDLNL